MVGHILILGPDLTQPDYYAPAYSTAVGHGQWLDGRPLSNLIDPHRIRQAHTLNLTDDATQFVVDLQRPCSLRGFAINWGNWLAGDAVSIDIYNDAALTSLAGSLSNSAVFRAVKPLSEVRFDGAGWFDGLESAEERARGSGLWFDILPEHVTGRYLHVSIDAARTGDGVRSNLQLGRFLATPGFRPEINAALGSSIEVRDESIRTTDVAGADHYSVRPTRRVMTFIFRIAEENQAMAKMLDLAASVGTRGQVVVAWDEDDTTHRVRRSMHATVEKVDPFVAQAMGRFSTAFRFREVVA
jgi:hypothetical protein